MKLLIKFLLFISFYCSLVANDGTYLSNGSIIYPINEIHVSLEKEIIRFKCLNGIANVNVYFEFKNPLDTPIRSLVGFVSPFYYFEEIERNKPQNLIRNFVVISNDRILPYTRKWTKCDTCQLFDLPDDYTIEDFFSGEIIHLFDFEFKPGINKISHSFEFSASSDVFLDQIYTYILQTGKKWSGGTIKDFTLEIDMGENQLLFVDDIFGENADWKIIGSGKICYEKLTDYIFDDDNIKLVRLNSGYLRVQTFNFAPEKDIYFGLIDRTWFISRMYNKGKFSQDFFYALSAINYDDSYEKIQISHKDLQLLRNLIYAQYNYDFKNKEYKNFFSQFEWYMPDPNLKMENIKLSETHKNCLRRILELEKRKK